MEDDKHQSSLYALTYQKKRVKKRRHSQKTCLLAFKSKRNLRIRMQTCDPSNKLRKWRITVGSSKNEIIEA